MTTQDDERWTRRSFTVGLAGVPLVGCASAIPAISAALPAIFNAIGIAGAAISTIEAWLNRFETAPGVPPETVADIRRLLDQARKTLAQASQTVQSAGQVTDEAKRLYAEGRALLTAALELLQGLGLFDGRALTPPVQSRTGAPGEALELHLPPETL